MSLRFPRRPLALAATLCLLISLVPFFVAPAAARPEYSYYCWYGSLSNTVYGTPGFAQTYSSDASLAFATDGTNVLWVNISTEGSACAAGIQPQGLPTPDPGGFWIYASRPQWQLLQTNVMGFSSIIGRESQTNSNSLMGLPNGNTGRLQTSSQFTITQPYPYILNMTLKGQACSGRTCYTYNATFQSDCGGNTQPGAIKPAC